MCFFSGIFLINCSQQGLGRGYRYEHGGSYIGSNPSFSSDGRKIVFGSLRDGHGDIYVMNSDGTNMKRLTNTSAYEGEPGFSPDDSKIVFISERDDLTYGRIYIMDSDGSNQKRLTFDKAYDYSPKFSPDNKSIIFGRDKGNHYTDIYSISVDGSKLKRLTFDENPKGNLQFSRDGDKIRYSSLNLKTVAPEIYEMSMDGHDVKLILKLSKGDYHASYSKDDENIVFVSSRMTDYKVDFYTRTEIFTCNFNGANLKQLTQTKTYKSSPTFSPNGQKIMFLSQERDGRGKGQIMTMNSDGSDLKVIANNY